mmetsp:Transcript_24503/g.63885  ORF Transcript_24503/g.63885 Transcript_24503/m.63885 type:complete len:96 (+) Transcript_24503:1058-1345(+)
MSPSRYDRKPSSPYTVEGPADSTILCRDASIRDSSALEKDYRALRLSPAGWIPMLRTFNIVVALAAAALAAPEVTFLPSNVTAVRAAAQRSTRSG